MDWFLYDKGLRHEIVKGIAIFVFELFRHNYQV